jgi:divalent metal cation (Fe/Co/Zn/Cd) transporter
VTARESVIVEVVREIADRIVGRKCCHSIVIRRQGARLAVSLHCAFDRDLPIVEAHRISTEIETALKKEIPSVDHVLVHTEPENS